MNTLYYGDNLKILCEYIKDKTVLLKDALGLEPAGRNATVRERGDRAAAPKGSPPYEGGDRSPATAIRGGSLRGRSGLGSS